MMMTTAEVAEQKQRRPHGFLLSNSIDHSDATTCRKRFKPTTITATTGAFPISPKEKKDGIGERVAALQQLVSPFGKTDTASVLLEATEYIRFLHDQLQVLSAPYLRPTTTGEVQEAEYYSLSGRGLCLTPVASAQSVARSNGADLWAPSYTSKPNYKLYLGASHIDQA